MRRFLLFLLVVVMSAAAMAPAGAAPSAGGAVVYPIVADPTFNPWHPRAFVESVFPNRVIFPGLTRPGRDLRPAPDLAERWEISRDGLTWTFFLRRGVKWHDGRDFTAEDVKFTFDLVLNPRLGAQNRGVYGNLREVQIVNPTTVRFLLRAPQASLATVLGINSGMIPKHAFDGVSDPWTLDAFNKRAPIGTGPYRVQTYVPGSSVTLARNDAYFGGRPNLDSVTFKVLPDPNTQVAQLLSGELSLAIVDNPALVAGLQGRPEIEISQIPQVQFYWLAVNHANPILNDKRLKQAMMHAVDRPAMVRGFLQGYARPATGMISPALSYFYRSNVKDYPFDREQARKLLSEAGWRPGPDRVLVKDGRRASFTLTFPTVQMFPGLAALVQQYFREIGIDVQLDGLEFNQFISQRFLPRRYELILGWWIYPADPDVFNYAHSSTAAAGFNVPQYKGAELDRLLEQGRASIEPAERARIYEQVQKVWAEELPYMHLWWPNEIRAINRRIQNVPNLGLRDAFQYVSEWQSR